MKFTKIDANLTIFYEKEIILWGNCPYAKKMLSLFRFFSLEPSFVLVEEKKEFFWEGVPVISLLDLKEKKGNFLVQLTNYSYDYEKISQIALEYGIKDCLFASESWHMLRTLVLENLQSKEETPLFSTLLEEEVLEKKRALRNYILEHMGENLLLICLPPKTGDHSLMKTFEHYGVEYFQMMHVIEGFERDFMASLPMNVKIITAVRDPIAQNLSLFFEYIAGLSYHYPRRFPTLFQEKTSILADGGDTQELFNQFLAQIQEETILPFSLIPFLQLFSQHIFDLSQCEFNQEKGFSILQKGNIQVFVYQLENMDNILEDMSIFVQKPMKRWIKGNEASGKWVASTYQKAQAELHFPKGYLKASYEAPFVSQFYSPDDIKQFQKRWEMNHDKNF